jgi:hypothetical protein
VNIADGDDPHGKGSLAHGMSAVRRE